MGYLEITTEIASGDRIQITDREHPDLALVQIFNLQIGRVTFMVGRSDLERVAILDRLIVAAQTLRQGAAARIAAANVEIVDMAPGELVELFGR